MIGDEESILTIDKDGGKEWRNKSGELHRIGGPAIEHTNGDKYWYQNGKLHRIDGPVVDCGNGHRYWYLRDKLYPNKEEFFDALTDEEKEIALFSEDFLNA